jgi:hypothetical protein
MVFYNAFAYIFKSFNFYVLQKVLHLAKDQLNYQSAVL